MRRLSLLIAALLLLTIAAAAADHGILVRETVLYISPDTTSAKLVTAERGREVAILEKTRGWQHVIVEIAQPMAETKAITGWVLDKGIITKDTPNGDQIIYGEAVDSENQASTAHGRKGAATDARRLYYRVFDYFPQSPLAGEGLFRAADIQWQLDKADVDSRKSHSSLEANERPQIDDELMKTVEKKFPRTKWADLAAFRRLDNKLCGDWQARSKCPEKEIEIYTNYAQDRPDSPKAGEAWLNAAYRAAALKEIYRNEGQANKIPKTQENALALAQRAIAAKNSSADITARAHALLYDVQNNIPVYGNVVE